MSEKVAFGEEFNNAFLSFLLCLHLFFFFDCRKWNESYLKMEKMRDKGSKSRRKGKHWYSPSVDLLYNSSLDP